MKAGCFTAAGKAHIRQGKICQDYAAAQRIGRYELLIVLDGCSSAASGGVAAYSIGRHLAEYFTLPYRYLHGDRSMLTGEALCRYLLRPGNERYFADLMIGEAHRVTSALCTSVDCGYADCSSTMQLAVIEHDKENACGRFVMIGVGDGFAAMRDSNGSELITAGENIGGRDNRTYFVTSPDAYEHARVYRGECGALLLSTDGLSKAVDIRSSPQLDALMKIVGRPRQNKGEAILWDLLSAGLPDGSPLVDEDKLYDDLGAAYCCISPQEPDGSTQARHIQR